MNWSRWSIPIIVVIVFLTFTSTIAYTVTTLQWVQDAVVARPNLSTLPLLSVTSTSEEERLQRLKASLEIDFATMRHQRAMTALYVRTWIKFLGLIFGSLMVLVGCAFVLARIREPPATSGELTLSDTKGNASATLRTAYPGVVLAAIGAILVAIPNLSTQLLSTGDSALFLTSPVAVRIEAADEDPAASTGEQKFTDKKPPAGMTIVPAPSGYGVIPAPSNPARRELLIDRPQLFQQ